MQDTELKDIRHLLNSISTEEKGNIAIALNLRGLDISKHELCNDNDTTYKQALIVVFITDILQFCRFRFSGSHLEPADAAHQNKYRLTLLQMGFNQDENDPLKDLPVGHMFPPHACSVEITHGNHSKMIFTSSTCENSWTFHNKSEGQVTRIGEFNYDAKNNNNIKVLFDFVKEKHLEDIMMKSSPSHKFLKCKYIMFPGDGNKYSSNDLFVCFFRKEFISSESLLKIFDNRKGIHIGKDFFTSDKHVLSFDFLKNSIELFRIRIGDGDAFYDPECESKSDYGQIK